MNLYRLGTNSSIYQGLETDNDSMFINIILILYCGIPMNEILKTSNVGIGILENLTNAGYGNTLEKIWNKNIIKVKYTIKKKTYYGIRVKKGDIFAFSSEGIIPTFSKKAIDILGEDFIFKNGELLPVECEDGNIYYVMNVLKYLDILDLEKTQKDNVYMRTLVFRDDINKEEVNKTGLFRVIIPSSTVYRNPHVYVTDAFIQKVHKYKLEGFYVTKVTPFNIQHNAFDPRITPFDPNSSSEL